jgi:hypothetical protein
MWRLLLSLDFNGYYIYQQHKNTAFCPQNGFVCPLRKELNFTWHLDELGVRGWGTMLQAGRSPVWVPDEVDFFILPNSSSRTKALGSAQPLTEMSTRNFPGDKKQPARMADNLAAICEPQPLTTQRTFTARTRIALLRWTGGAFQSVKSRL